MQGRVYSPPKLKAPRENKNNKRKTQKTLLYSREAAHPRSFYSTRAGGAVTRQKGLYRFFTHLLQANDGFFSCCRKYGSVFAAIVGAKTAAEVSGLLVKGLDEHPGILQGVRETRTLARVQVLAVSLSAVRSATVELPHP